MAKKNKEQVKGIYDPTKQYTWQPTDVFMFNGLELGALYSILQEYITGNTCNVQTILKVTQLYDIVQSKIKLGVENLVIKEKLETPVEGSAPVTP